MDTNRSIFEKIVKNYLNSMCSQGEFIIIMRDKSVSSYDFYTETGIRQLNITPKTYIDVKYYGNPQLFDYHKLRREYDDNKLVVFVNAIKPKGLTKEEILSDGARVIFLDDIKVRKNLKYRATKDRNRERKAKCINIDSLNDYLCFIYRYKLLSAYFKDDINENQINREYKSKALGDVFPFEYLDRKEVTHIFFEYKTELQESYRKYLKGDNERILFHQISYKKKQRYDESEEIVDVTVSTKRSIDFEQRNTFREDIRQIRVERITSNDISYYVKWYVDNDGYDFPDFYPIFKYRQFTAGYDEREPFKEKDMCLGINSAITKDQIWFSTYKQLNDPFDMVIREPKKITKDASALEEQYYAKRYDVFVDKKVAVFCAVEEDDSILMWSHYADSHKGICSAYSQNKLLDAIECEPTINLCLYGYVKYSKDRPQFRITTSLLRYYPLNVLILIFNIKNLFLKYKDWQYEKEKRFIIFSQDGNLGKNKGQALTLKANDYVLGCNFPVGDCLTTVRKYGTFNTKFDLSTIEYKLIQKYII